MPSEVGKSLWVFFSLKMEIKINIFFPPNPNVPAPHWPVCGPKQKGLLVKMDKIEVSKRERG